MNYYNGKDLARAFRTVRSNTIQVATELPEEKYNWAPAPDTRTLGQLLVHIAMGPGFQEAMHRHQKRTNFDGVDFPAMMQQVWAEERKPRTKDEIVRKLTADGEDFAGWLETLDDRFLAEPFAMPPGQTPATKSRFEMLMGVKEHEMHHRGQLMLIERLLGQTPHLTRRMQERMAQRT